MRRSIKAAHVNIYELITHLTKEERNQKLRRLLLQAGTPPPQMPKNYKKLNQRVTNLTEALESGQLDLPRFIRKMAYALYEPAETQPPLDRETVGNERVLPVDS